MYKATVTGNVRKNGSNLARGSNNVPGLEPPFIAPVDRARMSTVNTQPFAERDTFQNRNVLLSPATSSGPMLEFFDSELQLPMPRNISHPSPTARNITQTSLMPRNGSHTSSVARNVPPRPSPMPRNVPHPSQMAQNTPCVSPMALGPYQQAQMNPITSPYEQNMMREYFHLMMQSHQNPPSMMCVTQSPSNQIKQHQMISKIPTSVGCPQDVRFSPYPRQPPTASSATAHGLGRDQTFVMHSTKANSSWPSDANESAAVKPGKASMPAKTNKNLTAANNRRFFMGTIEQVVRWYKTAKEANLYVIYKTAGVLESMTRGKWDKRVMVLRDHRDPEERVEGVRAAARPLQLVFHPIDRDLSPAVVTGQLVTCVGRMLGENKMQVLNVEPTTKETLIGLKRISFLCQWALQEATSVRPAANEP